MWRSQPPPMLPFGGEGWTTMGEDRWMDGWMVDKRRTAVPLLTPPSPPLAPFKSVSQVFVFWSAFAVLYWGKELCYEEDVWMSVWLAVQTRMYVRLSYQCRRKFTKVQNDRISYGDHVDECSK